MATLKPGIYEIDLAWKGGVRRTFRADVDPNDSKTLRKLLLAEMKSFRNDGEPFLDNYELRLRKPGQRDVVMPFKAAK